MTEENPLNLDKAVFRKDVPLLPKNRPLLQAIYRGMVGHWGHNVVSGGMGIQENQKPFINLGKFVTLECHTCDELILACPLPDAWWETLEKNGFWWKFQDQIGKV